jgi:mono/diheme cytochrome c family protein
MWNLRFTRRKMKKGLFVILVLTALVLTACGGSGGGNVVEALATVPAEYAGLTNPLGADAAAVGAAIFDTNCKTCHGAQGYGDGSASKSLDPRPKNLVEFAPTVGDDYLFWRISTGRDGTSMIGWAGVLTDEQIWQVVSFIRTLK